MNVGGTCLDLDGTESHVWLIAADQFQRLSMFITFRDAAGDLVGEPTVACGLPADGRSP